MIKSNFVALVVRISLNENIKIKGDMVVSELKGVPEDYKVVFFVNKGEEGLVSTPLNLVAGAGVGGFIKCVNCCESKKEERERPILSGDIRVDCVCSKKDLGAVAKTIQECLSRSVDIDFIPLLNYSKVYKG